jgi:hypothetical protein
MSLQYVIGDNNVIFRYWPDDHKARKRCLHIIVYLLNSVDHVPVASSKINHWHCPVDHDRR